MSTIAIIPARLDSVRLPGKLLLRETGIPLILHTVLNVLNCQLVDRVRIAASGGDAAQISDAIDACHVSEILDPQRFDIFVTGDADNGTVRSAMASVDTHYNFVVNVQGDEPEVASADIDRMIMAMQFEACDMVTLVGDCPAELRKSPDVVKCVHDSRRRALYFSRSPLPGSRRHIGVYGYRREILMRYAGCSPSPLEIEERLEQLRALEKLSASILCVDVTGSRHDGINTKKDYAAFVKRHEGEFDDEGRSLGEDGSGGDRIEQPIAEDR